MSIYAPFQRLRITIVISYVELIISQHHTKEKIVLFCFTFFIRSLRHLESINHLFKRLEIIQGNLTDFERIILFSSFLNKSEEKKNYPLQPINLCLALNDDKIKLKHKKENKKHLVLLLYVPTTLLSNFPV